MNTANVKIEKLMLSLIDKSCKKGKNHVKFSGNISKENEMDIKHLPKACQLCFSLQDKNSEPKDMPNYSNFGDFQPCASGESQCLPKDRAILLLMHKLIKRIENSQDGTP